MKKVFFCLVVLILCFQLISAIDTHIDIKTVPLKNVNLVVSTNDPPYIANKDANEYGDVFFVFPSDYSKFDLTIFVKDVIENKKVAFKKLENQIAGEDIYIEVVPSGFEIVETPSEEETNTEENKTLVGSSSNETEKEILNEFFETDNQKEEKSKILGWVVFGENGNLKNVMISIGGIVVLALIIFFVFKKFKKKKNKIQVKKLSAWMEEKKNPNNSNTKNNSNNSNSSEDYSKAIEEAQKKIEEAQREINQLKNRDKIKQAEEKLKRDEQELRNLRGF